MHRELRDRLTRATGESDLVVVVFLDVRGFSSFAGMAESSEAALFLRSAYTQILDEYFPEAAFFKPTGDGLMIIRHFDDDSLADVVFDSVEKSVDLVSNFGTLTDSDPMVNFDVPDSLGIGIARGAATRLISDGYTLDYSGRPLNLAARLMDVARPSGVVVDGRVVKGLEFPAALGDSFETEQVYVKGIADLTPIEILRTGDVELRPQNRRPMMGKPHRDKVETMTFREFCERTGRFAHHPSEEPLNPEGVRLWYQWPAIAANGRKHPTMVRQATVEPVEVRRTALGWEIIFDYGRW
jgi:class 3 adenylate cyclase